MSDADSFLLPGCFHCQQMADQTSMYHLKIPSAEQTEMHAFHCLHTSKHNYTLKTSAGDTLHELRGMMHATNYQDDVQHTLTCEFINIELTAKVGSQHFIRTVALLSILGHCLGKTWWWLKVT